MRAVYGGDRSMRMRHANREMVLCVTTGLSARLLPATVSMTTKSIGGSDDRPIWNMSASASWSYCTMIAWPRLSVYDTECWLLFCISCNRRQHRAVNDTAVNNTQRGRLQPTTTPRRQRHRRQQHRERTTAADDKTAVNDTTVNNTAINNTQRGRLQPTTTPRHQRHRQHHRQHRRQQQHRPLHTQDDCNR